MIGNNYTNEIANFLREIERSSIPDTIKHFVICGRNSDEVFCAFDVVYESHAPLPFKSKSLFRAIESAIKIRIEQAIHPELLEALRSHNVDLADRLELFARQLNEYKNKMNVISFDQYKEIKIRLSKSIELENKQINVETLQGTKKINIKKLVIPARLSKIDSEGGVPYPHKDSAKEENKFVISYLQFRRTFNRAIVLGDPGGGKSTLTQLICHGLASQVVLENNSSNSKNFDSQDIRIPLRVVLRSLERRQKINPSYSILDYLTDEIRAYLDNDAEISATFLRQLLSIGQAVVLFDGLDEVLEVGKRRNMSLYIEQFANAYACCPILVTSRIVGYSDAPLSDEFQMFTLSRFNIDEIKKFSELLICAVASSKILIARERAEQFIFQTENIASDLRENPLLLGLMVYIFATRGDVPNNRPEIYKECSLLMFEKWDQRRDIIFEFPNDFDLIDLFGYLASRIFGNAETEDGVSEDWLMRELRKFFGEWYEDKAKAFAASKVLVDFITGRAWVMCEVGPKVFKFTHRTFLEYFFAKRIEEESESVQSLINERLFPKIINAEWDVVSHLSIQISVFRSGPKSMQAAETLLNITRSNKLDGKREINFLDFFCRALEYIILPENKHKEIAKAVFERVVFLGSKYNIEAREIIYELLKSTERRENLVSSELSNLISFITDGPSSDERTFCIYLIGTKYAGFRVTRRSQTQNEAGLIWNSFKELREKLKESQFERALSDINEARNFVYLYKEKLEFLYDRFGIYLLFSQSPKISPSDLEVLPYLIVMECINMYSFSRKKRHSTLETFGNEAEIIVRQLALDAVSGKFDRKFLSIIGNTRRVSNFAVANDFVRDIYVALRSENTKFTEILSKCFICIMLFHELEEKISFGLDRRLRNKKSDRIRIGHNRSDIVQHIIAKFSNQESGGVIQSWIDGSFDLIRDV